MKQLDFIQNVARELSISEEESQELLREFSVHLNNELNETDSVQLTGLGTLNKDISGISLELDPSFAIEINYKYAGMQPIVVSDDFNVGIEEEEESEVEVDHEPEEEPEVDVEREPEEERESIIDKEPDSEQEPEAVDNTEVEVDSEPEEESEGDVEREPEEERESVVDKEPDSEQEPEAVDNTEVEVDSEPEEETQSEEEVDSEPEEESEGDVEREPEEEQESEPDLDDEAKARIAKRTASLRSPKKTKKSNLTPIYIGIGVVFIAAMIAGWQFYLKPILDEPAMLVGDSSTEPSNVTEAIDSDSISEEQQPSAALYNEKNGLEGEASGTMGMNEESSIISPENSASRINTDSVVSAPIMAKNVAEIPADQPRYGLMGEVDTRANDGYTLVLFSLSNRQSAMEKYELYRSAGYRSLLSPVNSSRFGLMWRVSIGQFSTVEQALEVAKELPKDIIEDYFITKI
ncbi:MAG: SPOR domain-containing protein [Bacteroidetes bacterium]|nr:SPOR domain-containing protein [Bacteroidota bacterium]